MLSAVMLMQEKKDMALRFTEDILDLTIYEDQCNIAWMVRPCASEYTFCDHRADSLTIGPTVFGRVPRASRASGMRAC
eukprot:1455561-Pyramimonas_sp.AAC.2